MKSTIHISMPVDWGIDKCSVSAHELACAKNCRVEFLYVGPRVSGLFYATPDGHEHEAKEAYYKLVDEHNIRLEYEAETMRMLRSLWSSQAEWSQRKFGSDDVRGPIGALKHLQKEADEAMKIPHDPVEFSDCLLLVFDSSRRAGMSFDKLIRTACEKHEINKTRNYPKPDPATDDPVEHVREQSPEVEAIANDRFPALAGTVPDSGSFEDVT